MNTMSRFANSSYGAVIRALEGVRNTHALLVLLAGFLLVGLVIGLGTGLAAVTGSFWLALLLDLAGLVLGASVVNAAGLALMDAARSRPARGFTALLAAGAGCFVSFLAVVAVAVLSFLAYLLVAAILLWVCKLPLIGPVLLAVLVPVLVLGASLLMLALFVAVSLVLPALWVGSSIRDAIRQLVAVVTHRPLEVLVSLILLSLLVGLIAAVASAFLFAGSTMIGGLAAAILGSGFGMHGAMEGMGGGSPGLAIAGAIGFMLVFALLSGVLAAIHMNGVCHIYLQVVEGTDAPLEPEAAERTGAAPASHAAPRNGPDAGAGRDAPGQVEASLATTLGAIGSREVPPTSVVDSHCPACGAAVTVDDRFCGECGGMLKG